MIDNSPTMLLYIEPQNQKSDTPIVDDLTKKMTAAFRKTKPGMLIDGKFKDIGTMGWHTCCCRARSDNTEHVLENMQSQTNSLCIHYLAWHRQEVPQSELDKVALLLNENAEPSAQELQ